MCIYISRISLRSEKILFKMFFWVFLILLPAVLSASKIHKTNVQSKSLIWPLCSGYTLYDESLASSSAIANCSEYVTGAVGSANFKLLKDSKSLETELGLSGHINIPFKFGVLNAISKFKNSYVSDSLNLSLIYTFTFGHRFIAKPSSGSMLKINSDAASLYHKSSSDFVSRYGNSYIDRIEAGVKFFVMVKIHFASQDEKADFASTIGLSGKKNKSYDDKSSVNDMKSMFASLNAMYNKKHISGNLSLEVLQLGGDPTQLAKLFGNNKSTTFDFSSLDDASKAMDVFLSYPTSLKQQVTDSPDSFYVFSIGKPFAYKTIFSDYSLTDTGNLTSQTLKSRAFIEKTYENLQDLKSTIVFRVFEKYPNMFSETLNDELSVLKVYISKLSDFFNSNDNNSIQAQCYTPGSENQSCQDAAKKLNEYLPKNFEKIMLDAKQLSYTVNYGDKFAGYPISTIKYNKTEYTQQFVFISLRGKKVDVDISMPTPKDKFINTQNNFVNLAELAGDEIQLKFNRIDKNGKVSSENKSLKKIGDHTFINSDDNRELTFLRTFYEPYPKGKIHVNNMAMVSVHFWNKTTGKEGKTVLVKGNHGIDAVVGDIIEINPYFFNHCIRDFIVVHPGSVNEATGKMVDNLQALPLNGSINVAGTAIKCKYFHVSASN